MALLNNNFFGEIVGRNIYSFLGDLNYDLTTSTERIEHLKKILYTEQSYPHPFFERLFEQTYDCDTGLNTSYVKLILNTTDVLYTDTNVADVLRKMADYVLFTKEGRELNRSNLTQYKIYKDARLFEKIQKELSLEAELEKVAGSTEEDGDIDTLIHILVKDTNHRKDKSTKITADDFNDPELGHVIKGYQQQINYMRAKFEKNQEIIKLIEDMDSLTAEQQERFNQLHLNLHQNTELRDKKVELLRECKMLAKHIHSMRQDMLDCKEMIKRPIVFKSLLDGHPEPSYDDVEFISYHMEDIVPWFRAKAEELKPYYEEVLSELQSKGANQKKIEKYRTQLKMCNDILNKSDEDVYEIYSKQLIDMVQQLLEQTGEEYYDLQDEMQTHVFLVEQLLKKVELDELDKIILRLRRTGFTHKAIAKIISEEHEELIPESERSVPDPESEPEEEFLLFSRGRVGDRLKAIAKRIIKAREEEMKNFLISKAPDTSFKVCSKCEQRKHITKFHKDSKSKDGLKKQCKECR